MSLVGVRNWQPSRPPPRRSRWERMGRSATPTRVVRAALLLALAMLGMLQLRLLPSEEAFDPPVVPNLPPSLVRDAPLANDEPIPVASPIIKYVSPVETAAAAPGVFLRRGGDGWAAFDGNVPSTALEGFECRWTTYEAWMPDDKRRRNATMCVHPEGDDVSDAVYKNRIWWDCYSLPIFWQGSKTTESSVFVDIGANIGSCVVHMLLMTDAKIVAFEPDPRNARALMMTLSRMDERYRDRVSFFPIALGSAPETSTINTAVGNSGNAVVGKVIKDRPRQKFNEPVPIRVERLDSILNARVVDAPVVKIDVQGYECNALNGMGDVLSEKVQVLKFETEEKFLQGSCTGATLLDRIRAAGFEVHHKGALQTGPPTSPDQNMVAIKAGAPYRCTRKFC